MDQRDQFGRLTDLPYSVRKDQDREAIYEWVEEKKKDARNGQIISGIWFVGGILIWGILH